MDTVTSEDLERALIWARAQAPSPTVGLFGPDSVTWRIDREAILFLAAGRALLMQLAHPWVAQGVADHSLSLDDPIGRFHRTFLAMFNFVFGTVDQALDAARRLHRRHDTIRGVLQHAAGPFEAGSPYAANHLPALRWVLLTLTDGAIAAYEAVLPPLTETERDRYVAENRILGAMFGIPPGSLPQDWRAFEMERDRRLTSAELTVTPPALRIAERLVVHPPLWLIRTRSARSRHGCCPSGCGRNTGLTIASPSNGAPSARSAGLSEATPSCRPCSDMSGRITRRSADCAAERDRRP